MVERRSPLSLPRTQRLITQAQPAATCALHYIAVRLANLFVQSDVQFYCNWGAKWGWVSCPRTH